MIDFKNSDYLKLRETNNEKGIDMVGALLVDGEVVLSTFTTVRDCVVFTNKRVIAVNIQGVTGKKKDYTILPYSKITAFSIETSGVLDIDSELELYFSGLGKVRFEFTGNSNVVQIGKIISEFAMR